MDFLNWLSGAFQDIANAIFELLPKSPIVYLEANTEIRTVISYINWFVPIYLWISILETWLTCIFVWYATQMA